MLLTLVNLMRTEATFIAVTDRDAAHLLVTLYERLKSGRFVQKVAAHRSAIAFRVQTVGAIGEACCVRLLAAHRVTTAIR